MSVCKYGTARKKEGDGTRSSSREMKMTRSICFRFAGDIGVVGMVNYTSSLIMVQVDKGLKLKEKEGEMQRV